jgi:IclR family pca regulon transcriptional regulator
VDLQSVQPRRLVRVVFEGNVLPPLHTTSGGKCYLAWQPRRIADAYVQRGLPAWGPAAITAPEALHRELAQVRQQGYALNREESDAGLGAMAVPLRGSDGSVVGAVTVWSTIADLSAATVERWLPLLRAAADELATLLVPGWRSNIARHES